MCVCPSPSKDVTTDWIEPNSQSPHGTLTRSCTHPAPGADAPLSLQDIRSLQRFYQPDHHNCIAPSI